MHQPAPFRGDANASLAHILAHAIESSDKPKHQIAREVGIHRETLLRVMRGDRPIGLDEAALKVRVNDARSCWSFVADRHVNSGFADAVRSVADLQARSGSQSAR